MSRVYITVGAKERLEIVPKRPAVAAAMAGKRTAVGGAAAAGGSKTPAPVAELVLSKAEALRCGAPSAAALQFGSDFFV